MRKIELVKDAFGATVHVDGKPVTVGWSNQVATELKATHGVDLESEMLSILQDIMKTDTDLSDEERAEVLRLWNEENK